MAQDRTGAAAGRSAVAVSKIPAKRGLLPPSLACRGRRLGGDEGAGDDRIEHAGQGGRAGGAHDLDEARLVDHGHLGTAGEEDLAAAPAEAVPDDVGAQRTDVLGPGHRIEGEAAAATFAAFLLGPLEGGPHHAGVGDGREGVDGHAGGRKPAQLPGQRSHDALGRAVATGVGGPPARTRRDAQDAPVPGGGHAQGQRRLEHVEVAAEMHVEQRQPVLLGAAGVVALPGDPGHVDHGVEAAALGGQFLEEGAHGLAVGDRGGRGAGRAAGGDDAPGRGLLGRGELLGAVEGHQRVDGDDEPAAAPEVLGDGAADATPAAGDDGHALAGVHGALDGTSSSSPSKRPSATQRFEEVAVAEPVAEPAAVVAVARVGSSQGCPSLLMRDGVQAAITVVPAT